MASESAPMARTHEGLPLQDEASARIASVTYRSRAVVPMSEMDLHRLAKSAQLRNAAEGVTGWSSGFSLRS